PVGVAAAGSAVACRMDCADPPPCDRTRDTVEAAMHELWSSASYEPHLLALPFALAPAAMLIVIAYAAVMRGAPILRGFLLGHSCALLPYAVVMMLSPSIHSAAAAEQLFRAATAFIPMAGANAAGFQ